MLFVLVRKVRDVWEWLNCMHVDTSDQGRGCNVKVWFPECPLFGGKNTLQKRFGTKDSVRCPEFRGGRFSEVANVLQVWDFQSVTRTLSALGSVSASRSVRSGRFYCMYKYQYRYSVAWLGEDLWSINHLSPRAQLEGEGEGCLWP